MLLPAHRETATLRQGALAAATRIELRDGASPTQRTTSTSLTTSTPALRLSTGDVKDTRCGSASEEVSDGGQTEPLSVVSLGPRVDQGVGGLQNSSSGALARTRMITKANVVGAARI